MYGFLFRVLNFCPHLCMIGGASIWKEVLTLGYAEMLLIA